MTVDCTTSHDPVAVVNEYTIETVIDPAEADTAHVSVRHSTTGDSPSVWDVTGVAETVAVASTDTPAPGDHVTGAVVARSPDDDDVTDTVDIELPFQNRTVAERLITDAVVICPAPRCTSTLSE